jgi:hypothetical protein
MIASSALLFLAVAAPASAVFDVEAEGFVGGAFLLHGSHGYRIEVTAHGAQGRERGQVSLLVRRRGEAASYTVPAVVAPTRSAPTSVLWAKSTSPCIARAARSCSAPSASAKGSVTGSGIPGARLKGVSFAHGRVLRFQFNKNHQHTKVVFDASLHERRGDVTIFREVQGTVGSGAFLYTKDLRTVALHPPAPFSGDATAHRDPNSFMRTLGGDLELHFSGRTVALTGPAVPISVVHARFTRSNDSSVSVGFR